MSWSQYFWPIQTGRTFFDAWTIVHIAFWLVVGANMGNPTLKISIWACWLTFIVGAVIWEVVEKFVVHQMLGWVAFPEVWYNSWISDILVAPLGGFIGYYMIKSAGGL